MKDLIYEINGKKYMLFCVPATLKNATKIELNIERYGCINQGLKEFKTGFFMPTVTIWNILVPEENVIAWNESDLI